jgi:hypothetical protein
VEVDPPPPVPPALLDRALLFAPGGVLTGREYRGSQSRLAGLDVFNRFRFELAARADEQYDVRIHWIAPSRWTPLLEAASELPYQAVRLDLRNLKGRAIAWDNFYRWDAQKRRASSSVSGPLAGDPKWRWKIFADARSETWNTGGALDFRLRKIVAGAEIRSLASDRFSWTSGFDVSTRHFDGAPEFAHGFATRYRATANYRFLNLPEKRLTADISGTSEIARLGALFAREQAAAVLRWLPQPRGDDYETVVRTSAGSAFGRVPFDELFIVGLERDNDLPLRAHIGTHDGKKGSAPIGRRYVLTNFEIWKRVFHADWFTLDAGPVFDTGRVSNGEKSLIDIGAALRLRILGSIGIVLSYARDLRAGRNASYANNTF